MTSRDSMSIHMQWLKVWCRNSQCKNATEWLRSMAIPLNILWPWWAKFLIKLSLLWLERKILCPFGTMIVGFIGRDIILLILITKRIIAMQAGSYMQLVKHSHHYIYQIQTPQKINKHTNFYSSLHRLYLICNITMVYRAQANTRSWTNTQLFRMTK